MDQNNENWLASRKRLSSTHASSAQQDHRHQDQEDEAALQEEIAHVTPSRLLQAPLLEHMQEHSPPVTGIIQTYPTYSNHQYNHNHNHNSNSNSNTHSYQPNYAIPMSNQVPQTSTSISAIGLLGSFGSGESNLPTTLATIDAQYTQHSSQAQAQTTQQQQYKGAAASNNGLHFIPPGVTQSHTQGTYVVDMPVSHNLANSNCPDQSLCFLKDMRQRNKTEKVEQPIINNNNDHQDQKQNNDLKNQNNHANKKRDTKNANANGNGNGNGNGDGLGGAGNKPPNQRTPTLVSTKLNCAECNDINFDIPVFFKEFFYHMFFPLSLPIMVGFEGFNYARNHRFLNADLQLITGTMMFTLNTLYVIYKPTCVTVVEICIANAVYALHKLMVASKYAYLSCETLDDLHARVYTSNELRELELISGWLYASSDIIDQELHRTAKRLGFDLTKVLLHVPHSQQEVYNFLGSSNFCITPSPLRFGYHQICLSRCLTRIVESITSKKYKFNTYLAITLGVFQAIIPSLVRVTHGYQFFGEELMTRVIAIMCSCITLFYFTVAVLFVFVGIIDYLRRAQTLAVWQILIDPADMLPHLRNDIVYAEVPENLIFADLSINQNIISWFVGRQTIQNFGLHFRKRIAAYTSLTFVLLVILMLLLVSEFFSPSSSSLSSEATMILVLYNLVVIAGTISVMIRFGSRGNDAFYQHTGVLARVQLAIRERLADSEVDFRTNKEMALLADREKLRDSDLLLDSVMKMLEVEDQINPVTILGIKASSQLMGSILTLAGSAVTVALRFVQNGK